MRKLTIYRAEVPEFGEPHGAAGECWSDELRAACAYSHDGAVIYSAEVDVSEALEIAIDSSADWDALDSAAGRADAIAVAAEDWGRDPETVSLIRYEDEDETGHSSITYRVVRKTPIDATPIGTRCGQCPRCEYEDAY